MNSFLQHTGIQYPIIGGAMYPCSNPELVAAVSEAGGIGIVQPLSLTFVHGYDFREGLKKIQSLTSRPIGLNILTEKSSRHYQKRMAQYLDIALEEGIRFIITALGNPRWVVDRVQPFEGVVYHDVTERKFAEKALREGVQGLICVNHRAGGHAGKKSAEALMEECSDLGVPLICAGGIGGPSDYEKALAQGYQGVQIGTRLIASIECTAHDDYKQAIIHSTEKDIVLTKKVTGVPLAVIETPYLKKVGTEVGPLAAWLLRNPRTKHWMRLVYMIQSVFRLRKSNFRSLSTKDYWQAGKSVSQIRSIQSVDDILQSFVNQAP